jgi:ABC-type transporter Mla subunit MlaD
MAISNGVNGHRVLADSAQRLLDRLEEPRTAEALNRLLDHAELLAYSATALDGLFRRAEELTDNVAASIAEVRDVVPPAALPDGDQLGRAFAQLPQLLDVAERLTAISKQPEFHTTLEALGKPETLNALTRLLGHMELLVFLADGADGLARRGEEITDNLRASLQEVSGTLKAFCPMYPALLLLLPNLSR